MHGGRRAGHSAHAALSDLRIGLWSGTLVLDLLGQDVRLNRRRLDPAGTLSAAGLLAALATVATGLADWSVSDGEDRRVGLFHGLLNVTGVTLKGASLAAGLAEHRNAARAVRRRPGCHRGCRVRRGTSGTGKGARTRRART